VGAGEGRGSPSVGISLSRERSQLRQLLNGARRHGSNAALGPRQRFRTGGGRGEGTQKMGLKRKKKREARKIKQVEKQKGHGGGTKAELQPPPQAVHLGYCPRCQTCIN